MIEVLRACSYAGLVQEGMEQLHEMGAFYGMNHVRNHRSPQWYDIVHFEHKLSWLCFRLPQKVSYQWRCISLLINSGSFPKLANVGLPPNHPSLEQSTL